MKPCLSQVCSLSSALEQDVEDYAAGQCFAIEAWFTKLENYLAANSLKQLKDLLAEHGGSKVTLTRVAHRLATPDQVKYEGRRLNAPDSYVDLPETTSVEPRP